MANNITVTVSGLTIGNSQAGDYTLIQPTTSANITQASTTTGVTSSLSGQNLTLSATVTAIAPGAGTPTGTVDFVDTTTGIDLTPGGLSLSGGAANITVTAPLTSQSFTVTYTTNTNDFGGSSGSVTVSTSAAIYVLNATSSGALTVSGNANITVSGAVDVGSKSSTAVVASGNAVVSASSIQVVGGVSSSGNAKLSPKPVTISVLADPFAALVAPSVSGSSHGAVSVSGNSSLTINPGIYTSIAASGNATLTMNPGIYVIAGGGFTVSGNANVTGSGVLIYNAGSAYPTAGGTFGAITLSGNGAYNLRPASTGTYAGTVIFQSRDNTQALTLSGNGVANISGSIYAANAALSLSGNGHLEDALVIGTLSISGNAILNALASSGKSSDPGNVTATAFAPAQIRTAYGINSIALNGAGQTIAIVDAYNNPAIFQSVDAFDSRFGVTSFSQNLYEQFGPATSFLTVLNQHGQTEPLPATDPAGPGHSNWEMEEALDVEWLHAVAPGADIVLVEANGQSLSDLMNSVVTAASQPGVSVVSMSWGFTEGQTALAADEATYDQYLTTPAGHQGVTFVASTGDDGTNDPEYPAFSPNVVAVGGTSLQLNADGSYNSETGWGYSSADAGTLIAGGGGVSRYESEPAYQQAVQPTGYRTTPDVSFVANPNTGVWVSDTYNLSADGSFEVVGGTSLSAPSWAGLFALVNQGRTADSLPTLNSSGPTEAQQDLYSLSQIDYHVIASRANGGYSTAPNYNLVTGLGTPVANLLVPDLVADNFPATDRVAAGAAHLVSWSTSGATAGRLTNAITVFDAVMMGVNDVHSVESPVLAALRAHGDGNAFDVGILETGDLDQARATGRDIVFAQMAADLQGGSNAVAWPVTSNERREEGSSESAGTLAEQMSRAIPSQLRVEDLKEALDSWQSLNRSPAKIDGAPTPEELKELPSALQVFEALESSRWRSEDQQQFSGIAPASLLSEVGDGLAEASWAKLSEACFAAENVTSALALIGLAFLAQDTRDSGSDRAGVRERIDKNARP